MRSIKFQLLYKGMPYSPENQDRPWFKKVYSLDELIATPIEKLSGVHSFSELVAKRQFTGLTDKNGVDIYEGDIVDCSGYKVAVKYAIDKKISYGHGDCGFTACISLFSGYGKGESIKVIGNIHQNPELLK